ncbi:MAG: hypothetical protein Q7O66_19200 [Dehalococcoidia bacterium]|nr:hypothetical protein [Dehalococcoidia bacterium]
MKMKVLDHSLLLALNDSSMRCGRSQNLRIDRLPDEPRDRYWINDHLNRDTNGQQEVRVCVVLDLYYGQTVWLDISAEEYAAIPGIEVSEGEWEVALCAGTPPAAP